MLSSRAGPTRYAHQEEALDIFLKDNPTVDPKYSRLKFPEVMKLTQTPDTEKNGIGHSTKETVGSHAEGAARHEASWITRSTCPRCSPTSISIRRWRIKTIAILGAGHGGCAAAADLTLRGFAVRLHARSAERLAPLRAAGGVEIEGVHRGLRAAAVHDHADRGGGGRRRPGDAGRAFGRTRNLCPRTCASAVAGDCRSISIPVIPAADCISSTSCAAPAMTSRCRPAKR